MNETREYREWRRKRHRTTGREWAARLSVAGLALVTAVVTLLALAK